MPIFIADQWNALREGSAVDENGEQYFTGNIIVTFFLDKPHKTHATGIKKKIQVEQPNGDKLIREQQKDESGKIVTKFYKILYEHQVVLERVAKTTTGFNGWMFKLSANETICLARGRSETRDEETYVEPPKDAPKDTKPKLKVVQVRTQSDALLDKIFTVK